jgi:hypothetical protein
MLENPNIQIPNPNGETLSERVSPGPFLTGFDKLTTLFVSFGVPRRPFASFAFRLRLCFLMI